MDFPSNIQEVPWLPDAEAPQVSMRLFRAWVAPGTLDSNTHEEPFAIHAPAEDGKAAVDLAMALEITPNLTVKYQKCLKFWGQTVLESRVEVEMTAPVEIDCTFQRSFESHNESFTVSGAETVVDLAFEVLLPTVRAIAEEMLSSAGAMLQAKEKK